MVTAFITKIFFIRFQWWQEGLRGYVLGSWNLSHSVFFSEGDVQGILFPIIDDPNSRYPTNIIYLSLKVFQKYLSSLSWRVSFHWCPMGNPSAGRLRKGTGETVVVVLGPMHGIFEKTFRIYSSISVRSPMHFQRKRQAETVIRPL